MERRKAIFAGILLFALVFLFTWEFASLRNHQNDRRRELVSMFKRLEPWQAGTNYSATGWHQLFQTARLVQQTDPRVVEQAVSDVLSTKPRDELYQKIVDAVIPPRDSFIEGGRFFVLWRVVFELPQSIPLEEGLPFDGWFLDKGEVQRFNTDKNLNLTWPILWTGNHPTLCSSRQYIGLPFDPAGDFRSFVLRFPTRDLSKYLKEQAKQQIGNQ